MKWKQPPVIKIYEALGSVVDGRIELTGDTAKVYSSSGNKYYDVAYDHAKNAIMTNDNGSYWKGYLGYPAISYLLKIGVLEYKADIAELLKGIKWKDVNQKFKNDFDKTILYIEGNMTEENKSRLHEYVESLEQRINVLNLSLLGPKQTPPEGY